jgi:hypothetical protein
VNGLIVLSRAHRGADMTRIGIGLMQKDESEMLSAWLKYHSRIFGSDSLYVLDNGSTDAITLDVLRKWADCGVTVIRAPLREDFDNKGLLLMRLFESLWDRYDWFIPLDCDEFVGVCFDSEFITAPEALADQFSLAEAAEKPIVRIEKSFLNIPHSTKMYPERTWKVALRSGFKVNLDVGFHLYDWLKKTDSLDSNLFFKSQIAYLHFHNRGYYDQIKYSKAKLANRISNFQRSTLRAYQGSGIHLVRYLLSSEEEYLASFKRPSAFDCVSVFSDFGISAPVSERRVSDSDAAEAMSTVNLRAYEDLFPAYTHEQLTTIYKEIIGSSSILQYGLNAIVLLACDLGVQEVVCVDNRLSRISEEIKRLGLRTYLDSSRLSITHYPMGETDENGFPVSKPPLQVIERFLEPLLRNQKSDKVILNGRYRVACAAASYLGPVSELRVMLFNSDRTQYEPIWELFEIEHKVQDLVLAKRRYGMEVVAQKVMQKGIEEAM